MTRNDDTSAAERPDLPELALRRVAAVTFDATGTLFTLRRLGETYAEVLGRHAGGARTELDPEVVAAMVRFVWSELSCSADPRRDRFASHPGGELGFWRRFVERVAEHLGLAPPSRFAVKELYHRFSGAAEWTVYPDVVPALDALRASGLRLAVVANWDSRLPGLLGDLGLADRFVTVVTSSAVGAEKPDRRVFEAALAALELPPERVLHVGDEVLADVEGAQAVEMLALHLDRRDGGGLASLVAAFARDRVAAEAGTTIRGLAAEPSEAGGEERGSGAAGDDLARG